MTEKQVRDYDKFMLRFPDGMRGAIAERAKQNGRSMNSEIVKILDDALSAELFATSEAALDNDYFPQNNEEEITLSKEEINELINKTVKSVIDHSIKQLTTNTTLATLEELSKLYDFYPKKSK